MEQIRSADVLASFPQVDEEKLNAALAAEAAASNRKIIVLDDDPTGVQTVHDIYVYTDKEIPLEFRTALAKKYSDEYEIDNRYFETGDEWTLRESKIGLDFMFRCPNWINDCINNVYNKHYASNGYTTCFLHNVYTSQILYDKKALELKNRADDKYHPHKV